LKFPVHRRHDGEHAPGNAQTASRHVLDRARREPPEALLDRLERVLDRHQRLDVSLG
jgi:hypothetical protein